MIPRRLKFICPRFGALCLFHLHRQVCACRTRTYLPMKMEQSVPKCRHINFRRRGITQKKAYNILGRNQLEGDDRGEGNIKMQYLEAFGLNLFQIQRRLRIVCFWRNNPQWARASLFTRFLDHTQRRTTVGRTPLEEWSARRRDLYRTTHNTHNRQTSMPAGGIRTHNLSRRAAADPRLRPRGHWDRPRLWIRKYKIICCLNGRETWCHPLMWHTQIVTL